MAPEIVQPGGIEAESSRTTDVSHNAPPSETQHQCRHELVHRDAAIVAAKNMIQDAHFKIACQSGSNEHRKQHAIGCESIHIEVDDGQLTV